MKTSKILLAMALPVAFAACTSEEIVENNNVNLQNRKALPVLTAVVESGVDSRFSWNEETFGWNKFTPEDNFAAGLTDAALWTPGDLMLTNYIFNDEAGNGSYTTTSQMVEGTYFFYSYPGFEEIAARKAVPFDLTSQKSVDFKKPAAAVEENQLFVSALYKLEEKTANDALPIKFISYWATAGMKIKNTTGDDIKVVRMMIQTGENMELRGVLAPSALGTVDKDNENNTGLVYFNDGEGYALPYDADAETNPSWDDIKLKDIANTSTDVLNALAEKTMMLTVENGELADDEEATVYFQMPAGKYSDASVTLFVEVYDEAEEDYVVKMLEPVEFEKNAKNAATDTENNRTAFQRGSTTAVFGIEDKALVAHEIVEYDIINAQVSGAYAASYEDLVEIVKNGTETKISNMGELKVDDAVLKLISSSTALKRGVYEFVNPIEISSTKTTTVALKNFTVKSATITSGKFSVDYDLKGTVTVNPGAEYTVTKSQTGAITNKATVNATGADLKLSIVDGADAEKEISTVVNIQGKNIIGNSASVQKDANDVLLPTIVMDKTPSTLNLKAAVSGGNAVDTRYDYTKLTVEYGKTLNVASKVELTWTNAETGHALKNNGKVVNSGFIMGLVNVGTEDEDDEPLQALVENSGKLGWLMNGGTTADAAYEAEALVKQMSEKANIASLNPTTPVNIGEIDNTIGSFVLDAAQKVYAEYTGNKSGKLGNVQSVDIVRGTSGTWTDVELPTNVVLELDGITFATAKTGANKKNLALSNTDITIKNGGATYGLELTAATSKIVLDGSDFTDLKIKGVASDWELNLIDVEVTGNLTLDNNVKTLTLVGTTLNNVGKAYTDGAVSTPAKVTTINVTPILSKNVAGKVNGITAATTTLNGNFPLNGAATLNIQKHATFKVAYGAVLGTTSTGHVTVNENVAHSADYASGFTHTCTGVSELLKYGTIK